MRSDRRLTSSLGSRMLLQQEASTINPRSPYPWRSSWNASEAIFFRFPCTLSPLLVLIKFFRVESLGILQVDCFSTAIGTARDLFIPSVIFHVSGLVVAACVGSTAFRLHFSLCCCVICF